MSSTHSIRGLTDIIPYHASTRDLIRTGLPLFRQFIVGWIAAIETEYLAARRVLDIEYDARKITLRTDETNIYTLVRISQHNIVIDTYSTLSATTVASGLQRNFPIARVVLMVGVGGGAPVQKDVHLGDIVVALRVVPYDFAKIHHNDRLELNGDVQASNSTGKL